MSSNYSSMKELLVMCGNYLSIKDIQIAQLQNNYKSFVTDEDLRGQNVL